VGATRVAKARSSATLLRAIRRRGRFATLRGLRHSHRRAQCSALTRSKQASVPPKEIPPSGSALARSYTEGTISSSFPQTRESSKTNSFTGFPLPRERRKGFLKQLLIVCLMEAAASPPLWERRVSRRRAPARHFCGPFTEGVASQPFAAYAAPTEEWNAAHAREANKRRCHRRRFRPPAARSRAATQKGLFLRHSRKRGNPVRQYRSLGSRFRGNDSKGE
jgi:hypothetical protein